MRRLSALLLAASPLLAQHDPVLTGVPEDATNLFVLRDPLPYVDALLKSNAMAEVGQATTELQQRAFGGSYQPAQLARMLTPFRDFVPTEVVVAMPPSSMHALAETGAAMLLGFLSQQPFDDDELKQELRDGAQEHMAKVAMPSFYVRVRARNERTAESWFESVTEALLAARSEGLDVTEKESSLEVQFVVGELGDGDMAQRIRSLGLDPTRVEAMRGAFTITIEGDALVLRSGDLAGDAANAGQITDAQLGALWQPKAPQLMFGTLDHEDALDVYFECYERVATVQDAMADTTSGMLVQMEEVLDRLTDLEPKVTQSLVVDDGFHWVVEMDSLEGEVELETPRPELLRCLGLASGSVTVVNLSLDVMVTAVADGLLGEMAQRADDEQVLEAYQATLDRGAGLFDFFGGEESSVFEWGCVFVVRESKLHDVRWQGKDLGELPYPAFAIVAPANDAAAGTAFCDRLAELVVETAGRGEAAWETRDLGLSAPTRTFAWQRLLSDGAAVGSGLELHHVQQGQWMILSTDSRLSKDLLERLGSKDLPPGVEPGLVARNAVNGEQLQSAFAMVGAWIEKLGVVEPTAKHAAEVAAAMQVIGRLVRHVDRYEDVLVLRGTVMRQETRLVVRDAVAATDQNARDGAKLEKAAADVKSLYDLARLVHLRDGRIPTMNDLTKKDKNGKAALDSAISDPWGHEYLIRATGPHRLEVRCMGPDGQIDTDDDLFAPDRR